MRKLSVLIGTLLASLASACGGGGNDNPPPQYEVATFTAPQSSAAENNGYGLSFVQFTEQTLRQVAHFSVGGDSLKIQFSNEFGTAPLTLDKVHVANSMGAGGIDPATDKAVTFSGQPSVTIPAGGVVYSDYIDYPTRPLADVAVSIYMKNAAVGNSRLLAGNTVYVGSGDLVSSAGMPSAKTSTSEYFMSQVVVRRANKVNVVVAIGDSITEGGATSTPDSSNDWPSQLSKFANAKFDLAVVNQGIGGNRWLTNVLGPCGLCRIDRDVLGVPGVTHVFMAMGVNDIGAGYVFASLLRDPKQIVTAAQLTAGIQAAIDKVKAKGIKVYVGTIGPFKGTDLYTSGQPNEIPFGGTTPYNGEAIRQEVNAFIRANTTIDGVLDVDKILQDPTDPLRVRPAWTADGLHPNDVGYTHIAQSIDLSKLR